MDNKQTPGSLNRTTPIMDGECSGEQNLDVYDTSKDANNNNIEIKDSTST